MIKIYGKVCYALKEDKCILSKLTLQALESGEYNLYTIEENGGFFHYKFSEDGRIMPDILYDYMSAFIEKRLGYKSILSGTGLRPMEDILKLFIK